MKIMATVGQYPLERAKILKKFIDSMIGWTILFGIAIIVTGVAAFLSGIAAALVVVEIILFVLLAIVMWWYQGEYYKKYFYDFEDDVLVIKKGVFMPVETTLPWDKIQDVYIDQDLLDRIFGLHDLHVSTATIMSGYHAHIDGVNKQNGEAMRSMMLEIIKKKKK